MTADRTDVKEELDAVLEECLLVVMSVSVKSVVMTQLALTATLADLIHAEAIGHLEWIFAALRLPVAGPLEADPSLDQCIRGCLPPRG